MESSPAHPADDDGPAPEADAEPTADTTARASPALVALEAKTSQLIDAATARKDPELFMRHLRQALEALVALKESLSAKPHEPKHEPKSAQQQPPDADDDNDANDDDNDATLLEGVAWAEVQRQFEASYVEKKSTPASLASAAGLERTVMDALIRRARFFCGPIHKMYPHNFAKLVRAVSELSERSPDEPRDDAADDDDDDDASAGADADADAAADDDQDQDAAASRPKPRMFLRVAGLSSDWARMSGADGAAARELEREAELVALFRSADHPQLSQQQPYRALSVAFSREGEAPSQDDDPDARGGGGGAERSTEVVAYVKFGHSREAAQAMRDLQVAVWVARVERSRGSSHAQHGEHGENMVQAS